MFLISPKDGQNPPPQRILIGLKKATTALWSSLIWFLVFWYYSSWIISYLFLYLLIALLQWTLVYVGVGTRSLSCSTVGSINICWMSLILKGILLIYYYYYFNLWTSHCLLSFHHSYGIGFQSLSVAFQNLLQNPSDGHVRYSDLQGMHSLIERSSKVAWAVKEVLTIYCPWWLTSCVKECAWGWENGVVRSQEEVGNGVERPWQVQRWRKDDAGKEACSPFPFPNEAPVIPALASSSPTHHPHVHQGAQPHGHLS